MNSEKIWKIWKISVLVIITPKETFSSSIPPPPLPPPSLPPSTSASSYSSSSSPSLPPPSSSSLYTCICIVFQNWEESSWHSFLLETMQVGIKFTISFIWLLEIPQWERGQSWSTTQQPRTYPKTTNFCVIIKDANKMAGKG